ncbi:MAG TPA: phosphopantetheine-binding protein, partial [Polyangiaceae bacterium]|nr:phosphopantetheine-binding protein [Polyangiaceae bacterium]
VFCVRRSSDAGSAVDSEENESLTRALRQHLASSLPDYMLPSQIVWLRSLPHTPSGKVDRMALPEVSRVVRAPECGSELQRQAARIWADILEAGEVSVDDDFFALGGHSILAMRLVSRIRAELEVELPLAVIFQKTTLGEQVMELALRKSRAEVAQTSEVEVSAIGSAAEHALRELEELSDEEVARLLGSTSEDA